MLWIELTMTGGQPIWVNLATFRTMQRSDHNSTYLVSLERDADGQPVIATVKETPEEILKLAGISKKAGSPAGGVGFIRRASEDEFSQPKRGKNRQSL
jgi:hypothetical protein